MSRDRTATSYVRCAVTLDMPAAQVTLHLTA
jgi:hypothetical protein